VAVERVVVEDLAGWDAEVGEGPVPTPLGVVDSEQYMVNASHGDLAGELDDAFEVIVVRRRIVGSREAG
jgi:hypothetical protein